MRYSRFVVNNYRAISGPLTIDISKKSLFPIIGINESGKTTVLQAIFAFDHYNDDLNEGRHLSDTSNLYKTKPPAATISAVIECSRTDLVRAIAKIEKTSTAAKMFAARWRQKRRLPTTLTITRNLITKKYAIAESPFSGSTVQDALAKAITAYLPYILYFDDFRDKVEDRIEIPTTDHNDIGGWAAIMEQLFKHTDDDLSIFDLATLEERQRKTVLAKVQRRLNKTLTKEWQNFRLDDSDALEIGLGFEVGPEGSRGYLKLEIVERDADGDDHFFFVSDRSKGFYWFFNFVMKLEFNPKVLEGGEQGSIYLLDEPGSYLHATAQAKLCGKLKALSDTSTVFYCTHSHYLLNPEIIPLSSIVVADKDGSGNISLVSIYAHEGNIIEQRSAFQPVVDALQIKPFMMDYTHSRVVLVEGIYDYYALEMFRKQRPISVLPSVGADSIPHFISLLIAWQVRFKALWDNDKTGRHVLKKATELFGEDFAKRTFLLLPLAAGKQRILQDLFDGADLKMLRLELGIDERASFEKTLAAMFFSPMKGELLNKIGQRTQQNMAELWHLVAEQLV